MSDSEFSSSESEEKIYIDNINPTPDNLFPLELNSHQYLPPLSSLKVSPKIKAQVRNLMKSPPAQELRKILFWQIYCKKLKDTMTIEVQDMLSALLSQSYASLMLLKIKERFEESLDILPIIIGHSIHYELWDIFKHSQSMFDLRFCLDCYKLIYFNLLGIRVSDIFVRSATQRILGDHFMYYYSRKTKTKHPDKKHVLSKALEEKMEEFPGGKEFAKELFHNHPSYKAVANVQKYDIETIQLEPSDQALQDKVDLHSREPSVRKSFLDSSVEKTFNCVKLSPMLCGYIDSSTKQVPFKVRHITPHKSQVVDETAPYFVKILRQHCEDKRAQSAHRIQGDIKKKMIKKFKLTNSITQSGMSILDKDPKKSRCFDEVFKLQAKLNEAFPIKLLYTNRSKYGL